jgi:putative membrane protein
VAGTRRAFAGSVHPIHLSTASTHEPLADPRGRRLPLALALTYGVLWVAAALQPLDRDAWWLENVLPLSLVALLAGLYRHWHLSDVSYLCTTAFLALHLAGAHYGYTEVPVGEWLRGVFRALGWGQRNPYDRVVHLAFGVLLVYPLREVLRHTLRHRRLGGPLAVAAVLALSGMYEVLEWGVARVVAPATASRFVGAQGDPWDAQQDMALAWVGATLAAVSIALAHQARARTHRRATAAPPPRHGRAPVLSSGR